MKLYKSPILISYRSTYLFLFMCICICHHSFLVTHLFTYILILILILIFMYVYMYLSRTVSCRTYETIFSLFQSYANTLLHYISCSTMSGKRAKTKTKTKKPKPLPKYIRDELRMTCALKVFSKMWRL